MTALINADKAVIHLDQHTWKLFPEDSKALYPLLEITRGDTVIYYNAFYGEKAGLPGDRLGVDYVRAVLVGYHEESGKWILGLHIAQVEGEKPVFRPLVRWTNPENLQEVRYAAQKLASLLVCPLKIVGEKKLPSESDDPMRSGVTGPLQPHLRTRISVEDIRHLVRGIKLPIRSANFMVDVGKNGVVVRLDKEIVGGDEDVPIFNIVEFNVDKSEAKLIPPTGLLGLFMKGSTRNLLFSMIYNLEFRYYKVDVSEQTASPDKKQLVDQLTTRHVWGVYLTLKDESLLLLKSSYTQSAELTQTRAEKVGRISKFETNSIEGINYFRKTLEEQNAIEERQNAMEHAAYIIAHAVGCPVVKTQYEI